jgi:hypothetical protein
MAKGQQRRRFFPTLQYPIAPLLRLINGTRELQITTVDAEQVEVQMRSQFLPRGLAGILYWYGFYPFHQWIFFGMLKSIAKLIGKPIVSGPERFTPKLHTSCALPPNIT